MAFAVAGHDDVLQREAFAHIVARLAHFTFVADENPSAIPDLAQLFGEDVGVSVERSMHLVGQDEAVVGAVGIHRRVDDRSHECAPFTAPKIGRRFSWKAATPSAKSSLPNSAA